MSFLTTDYSENKSNDYSPLPEGNYEMVIAKAQETTTKNGAESLQIDLVVRNDLDGVPALSETNKKYHNRHVFNDNWKRKATGQYDMEGFQYILEAVGTPEGTSIPTIESFIDLLVGKPVKVFVKTEDNTYNGETKPVNRVAPWNYSKTDFPNVQHKFAEGAKSNNDNSAPFGNGAADINDDDLPF